MHALEAGDDRDLLAFRETADQLFAVDAKDARRAVGRRRQDRQLPALPRARIDIEILQRDGEQSRGDLLAGRHHGVVLAGVVDAPLLQGRFAPSDELIGRAGHGRNDDGDFVPGIDLALNVARDVADTVDIGDRGAAEFHNETGHGGLFALLWTKGRV